MGVARSVDAKFAPKQRQLTRTTEGTGAGTVTPSPVGTACGAGCTSYAHGTGVTLTASPDSTSVFSYWTGACAGSNPVCNLFMNQDTAAVAVFTLQQRTLDVGKSGNGAGSITSDPAGISCGLACASESTGFDIDSVIALTATGATGSDLVGWTGPCAEAAGSPVCTVTMSEARSVTAAFQLQELDLNTTTSGNGAGDVAVDPTGTSCGTDCDSFDYGTEVTLTATPATGSDFTGWTGACSGSSATCTVTMDQARSVDASFTLQRLALALFQSGNGSGSVAASAAGDTFDYGTEVTLSAVPAAGSTFAGWSGDCSGSATSCTVTMDQARAVSAEFSDNRPALSALTVSPRKVRMRGSGRATLRRLGPVIKLTLSEASTVEFRLFRTGQVLTFKLRAAAGSSSQAHPGEHPQEDPPRLLQNHRHRGRQPGAEISGEMEQVQSHSALSSAWARGAPPRPIHVDQTSASWRPKPGSRRRRGSEEKRRPPSSRLAAAASAARSPTTTQAWRARVIAV